MNFVKRTIPQFFVDIAFFGVRRSTLVGQRPIKSLSSVRRLSVRPLLSFLKIGSGEFDRRSQIFEKKKKKMGTEFGPNEPKSGPK